MLYGDIVIIILQKYNAVNISFPVRLLTTAGKELVQLISITPNIEYIKELASTIKREGVTVGYSKIISIDEKGIVQYAKTTTEL